MNTLIADVIKRIADQSGYTAEDILGPAKHRMLAKARAVAMQEARALGFSYPELGKAFNRDHRTVMSACRKTILAATAVTALHSSTEAK